MVKMNVTREEAENSLAQARASFFSGQLESSYRILKRLEHSGYEACFVALLLSQIFLKKGGLQNAKIYAEKALTDKRFEGDALATLVEILLRQGNIADAKDVFKKYGASEGAVEKLRALLEERINLAEGQYESAIVNISELVVMDRNFLLAREACRMGHEMFRTHENPARYCEFIDALGLNITREDHRSSQIIEPPQGVIDIIIPIYNGLSDLKACLKSLEAWREPCQGKIILVDDCSNEETKEFLHDYSKSQTNSIIIRNTVNLGFTRSVEKGIEASSEPYFLLLNSDTIVTPGWLSGLWRALAFDTDAALAGPFSNNAFCQSLLPPEYDWSANELDDLTPQRLACLVRAHGKRCYPRIPFLSGFCLLVEREAYKASGGLDSANYPFGYWEVQDLSLKLLDMGRYGVLADDVYVHHRSGGSSDNSRRERLISDGLRKLASSYGAVRVLAAEEISQSNVVVQEMISTVRSFLDERRREATKHFTVENTSSLNGQASRTWLKIGNIEFSGNNVCIFAAYAPDGALSELTQDYLKALRSNGLRLIVSLACRNIDVVVDPKWLEYADDVLIRENSGFDFGSWADVLRDRPALWQADRLLFANDSVVPIKKINNVLQTVRLTSAGFFAMTDCFLDGYHAQSYFFGWTGANIKSSVLKAFWEGIDYCSTKAEVISQYEKKIIHLSKLLPDATTHIFFATTDILGPSAAFLEEFSITHTGWRALLENGCPFVKSRLLSAGSDVISDLSEYTETSLGALLTHAETVRFDRL
ncbi:MAG: hypothetical protein DCO95_18930 [Roseivirga sp. XM-24bin3]|nr:MAG: hypothetical protein DCO95_18930 [Roseivirga sp. XM-24bin3]